MTKSRSVAVRLSWAALIVGVVGLTAHLGLSFLADEFSGCEYDRVSSRPPDGRYVADTTFEDCGKAFFPNYYVSLRNASTQPAVRKPSNIVATFSNDLDKYPEWDGQRLIVRFTYNPPKLKRSRWRDVEVATRRVEVGKNQFD